MVNREHQRPLKHFRNAANSQTFVAKTLTQKRATRWVALSIL